MSRSRQKSRENFFLRLPGWQSVLVRFNGQPVSGTIDSSLNRNYTNYFNQCTFIAAFDYRKYCLL
jgi:hypothetical protein